MIALKNFAKVTVSTTYDATATSIVLSSGHGAKLPAPATDGAFNLVWWNSTDYGDPADDPNVEIVTCTARTTDTLTVTRAAEGTTGSTKNTASKTYKMALAASKAYLDSLYQVPQNSQSAAYTTVIADAGKHILHPSADTTARTFTIDSNANVAYPIGTTLTFVNQNGAGTVTIAITTDTMRLAGAGTTGSRTLAANGIATALKVTSTEWIISGTNLT